MKKIHYIASALSAITLVVNAGKVKAGEANVVKTDIAASDGVIHVIDTVLLP